MKISLETRLLQIFGTVIYCNIDEIARKWIDENSALNLIA